MKAERMQIIKGGPPRGGVIIPAIKLVAANEEDRQLLASFALGQLSLYPAPGPDPGHVFTLSRWSDKR